MMLATALAPKMAANGRGSIINVTTVFADKLATTLPLGRPANPNEIASAVVFLASRFQFHLR